MMEKLRGKKEYIKLTEKFKLEALDTPTSPEKLGGWPVGKPFSLMA